MRRILGFGFTIADYAISTRRATNEVCGNSRQKSTSRRFHTNAGGKKMEPLGGRCLVMEIESKRKC